MKKKKKQTKAKLLKELASLVRARQRSKDKQFVMDSYAYEDELKEQMRGLD